MRCRNVIPIVALALVLVLAPNASAARASYHEDSDKVVLSNAHVTTWILAKQPVLKVFPTGATVLAEIDHDEDRDVDDVEVAEAFTIRLDALVEYRDMDGDGAPGPNEVVQRLDLARGAWTAKGEIGEADAATLVLTLEAPVAMGAPLAEPRLELPQRTALVSLVLTLGATEPSVAQELQVERWPWLDAERHRLALDVLVDGALETAEEEGLLAAKVARAGTTLGVASWATTATGTTADGAETEVPVTAVARPEAPAEAREGEAKDADATRVFLTYDAANVATLAHGAGAGVPLRAGGEADVPNLAERLRVPGPALLAAVGSLGAVALALGRRR